MPTQLAASLLQALLGSGLQPGDTSASNRLSLERPSLASEPGGALAFRLQSLQCASLRLITGDFSLGIGRVVLRDLAGPLGAAG